MTDKEVFKRFFMSSATPGFILDIDSPHFTILEVNDSASKFLEIPESEIKGKSILDFFPNQVQKNPEPNYISLSDSLHYVIESGKPQKLSSRKLSLRQGNASNASFGFFDPENLPVLDERKKVTHIIHSIQDSSESQFSLLMNNTEESFILLDPQLTIVSFNKRFHDLYLTYLGKDVKTGDQILDYAQPERKETLKVMYGQVLKGETQNATIEIPVSGGLVKNFAIKYMPAKNTAKQIIGVFVNIRDITDEKKAESESQISRLKYQNLLQTIDGIFWEAQGDSFEFTYVSPQVQTILGFKAEEWLSEKKFWQNHIHPDDRENTVSFCKKLVKKKENHSFEYRMIRSDKSFIWINDIVTIVEEPGKPVLLRGLMVDITDRKTTEEEARKSQNALQEIMNQSRDIICSFTEEGVFIMASAAAERVWGYKPEELIGRTYFNLIHPDDLGSTKEAAKKIMDGNKLVNFENRCVRKNGEVIPVSWSTNWDEKEKIMYTIARDVSEKFKHESALIESEKKYKNLFENNPLPMFIWDHSNLQIIDCNEEALLKYGYTRKEFLRLTIKNIRPVEDIPLIEELVRKENRLGSIHKGVWRHKKKTGELMWMEVIGHLINYKGVNASLVLLNDITESKKAKDDLENSEKRFRAIIEKSTDMKTLVSPEGKILYASPSITNVLGYDIDEFISLSAFELIHLDDLPDLQASIEDLLLYPGKSFYKEYRILHKKGYWIWCEGSMTNMLQETAVNALVSNFRDISEKKSADQKIEKSEAFNRGVLNSLSSHIAVVNLEGKIIAVNESWTRFALENGEAVLHRNGVGSNYFKICEESVQRGEPIAQEVLVGMKEVLKGKKKTFYLEYPCHSPSEKRWFGMLVMRFGNEETMIVVSHQDITERKKVEEAMIENNNRYEYASKATFDAIWDWDLINNTVMWGDGFHTIFGYNLAELKEDLSSWTDFI
ncbi:MAG: PAS domain S-box protein, partial [Bacteroidota bacterium]|nr:PAS domain S-box protein [Bacteroidota bacterium]